MTTPTTETAPYRARYRFTTATYEQMVEAGILDENDRVELIEGEIIEMAPIGTRHAACVRRLNKLLMQQAGDRAVLDVQSPIHLDEDTEPQPDVVLLRPPAEMYDVRLPTPADVLLLVEVSDTTLAYDRTVKLRLYAQAGIPEVWIVNLVQDVIEVYTLPAGGAYSETRVAGRGETVVPTGYENGTLHTDDILL